MSALIGWGALLIAAAAVLVTVFLTAKRIGADSAREAEANKTLEAMEARRAIDEAVARQPDAAQQLRDHWTRD